MCRKNQDDATTKAREDLLDSDRQVELVCNPHIVLADHANAVICLHLLLFLNCYLKS